MSRLPGGAPRRILAAVDGSEPSIRAARFALDLAAATGARVTLLHVVEMPWPFRDFLPESYLRSVREEWKRQAERLLERVGRGRSRRARVETRIVEGSPAREIAKAARSLRCDLVVVGRRGLSGLPAALPGRVSWAVARGTGGSVLVVR
ncbi:MAG: universal stress protein [Halobacteria archaeon]